MLNDFPNHLEVNVEVVVGDTIPHGDNGAPGDFCMPLPETIGKLPAGLADDL